MIGRDTSSAPDPRDEGSAREVSSARDDGSPTEAESDQRSR